MLAEKACKVMQSHRQTFQRAITLLGKITDAGCSTEQIVVTDSPPTWLYCSTHRPALPPGLDYQTGHWLAHGS